MPDFREIAHGSADYQAAIELRERILRRPLGLAFEKTELEAEAADFHLGVFENTDPALLIGCLVLTPKASAVAKMRQVAVTETHRGRGIGQDLVRYTEQFARGQGFNKIVLHAREEVVPFYQRLGYEIDGDPFLEVTIPHRRMRKRLSLDS